MGFGPGEFRVGPQAPVCSKYVHSMLGEHKAIAYRNNLDEHRKWLLSGKVWRNGKISIRG